MKKIVLFSCNTETQSEYSKATVLRGYDSNYDYVNGHQINNRGISYRDFN